MIGDKFIPITRDYTQVLKVYEGFELVLPISRVHFDVYHANAITEVYVSPKATNLKPLESATDISNHFLHFLGFWIFR